MTNFLLTCIFSCASPAFPRPLKIRDIFMRYREDLPPVLKDLNLSIVRGSRVGIVGRTGAGKFSLVSAIFRLVEGDKDR